MRTSILLTLLFLCQGPAQAMRLEWDAPRDLRLRSEDGKLSLKDAQLREWLADGRETLLPLTASADSAGWLLRASRELDPRAQHALVLKGGVAIPVIPDGILDTFVCQLPLGRSEVDGVAVFRLFAPRALHVKFHLYRSPGDETALLSLQAVPEAGGSWSVRCPAATVGTAWTWSLAGPTGVAGWTDPELEFADPWATAVATRNDYHHAGRALLADESHDWKATDWRAPDPASLIIYETHLRDMSAGPGAGAGSPAGSYTGFWSASVGGLAHLRDLGVTAVEFLPLQDFGNIEIDYRNPDLPLLNTWNPWERNHWGYMTSAFLAPESYYGTGARLAHGGWCGLDGRQTRELKAMVDRCHLAGIAVIMDVVYNHVSQYDINPLKAIDTAYWFRLADDGSMTSASGCGNDLRTERPMARRLILDSIRHFAEEYRVDGFRFDLGAMLDEETLRLLHVELSARGLYHSAEPWGGGEYEPETFARLGWSWWNDQYRVDLRGRQPAEAQGFLFGKVHPESSPQRLAWGVQGYRSDAGGINPNPLQATNYVAAHDDHDLGDWIKIGLGLANGDSVITDRIAYQTLTPQELALHGVAALHLLSSAGVPMIHSGQELGRSKIIATGCQDEKRTGRVDHNSYEKDNATNWIDWRLKKINAPLVDLYRVAIAYRKSHPALATAKRTLLGEPTGSRLAWIAQPEGLAAAFNTHPTEEWRLTLPVSAGIAIASGAVRMEGDRVLVLTPRSAALLELR